MQEKISTVKNCRLCDSYDITEILNFGNVPLANNLREAANLDKEEFTAPLRVFLCNSCNSIQLFDEVNPEILFGHGYNYASPPNLIPHFKEYAKTVFDKVYHINSPLFYGKGELIVGIGGNVGLLEQEFQNLGCTNVINIEPAKNIAEISSKSIETINEFFTPELAARIVESRGQARLITANNMMAHTPDLNTILKSIKILLKKEGSFIFENAYAFNTFGSNLDVGQIYCEHYFYHSIKPLVKFFQKHGLEVFDVSLNNIQLGSFRCFVGWPGKHKMSSSVNNLIKLEEDFELYRTSTYQKFTRDVNFAGIKLVTQLKDAINNAENNGKDSKIALYGVPAKIVLLIKLFKLENYIDYACEESTLKIGKFVPGTNIEIKSRDFWISDNPAATIIGAYNFAQDIKNKNSDYQNIWITPFSDE